MVDARCAGCEEEFFRIKPGAELMGQLVNVADYCK